MDLKKEIKLSDLVRRPKKKTPAGAEAVRRRSASGERKQEIVGLKIGASQIAASRVVNNGSAKLVQLARVPLAPGVVVGGEVRDVAGARAGARRVLHRQQASRAAASASASPRTAIGVRTFEHRRDRGRAPARERGPLPRARGALDPARRGGARLPRRQRDASTRPGSVSRRVLLAAAYRESIDRYVAACRAAGIELVGIDLEAFALLRAVAPERPRATSRAPRSSPSRSATTARRSPSPTATSATSRASSSGAARSSRPRSRRELGLTSRRGRRAEARARSRRRRVGRRRSAARRRPRRGRRELQTLARELGRLAPVLPEPARLARDLRDPRHRRHDEASAASPRSSSA